MLLQKYLSPALSIFIAIGVGLAGFAGYYTVHQKQTLSQATQANGTVVELERSPFIGRRSVRHRYSYYPIVEFTTATGKRIRFRGGVASAPPIFHPGEAVTVFYEPSRPEEAKINTLSELWLLPLVAGGSGVLLILIGGCPLLYFMFKRRRSAWLREYGQHIQADVTEIILDVRLSLNGQHPCRLIAQWQDPKDQMLHTFMSDAIWFDPTPFVKTKKIDVLINPVKMSQYLIDLSFLPKQA